MIIGKAAQEQNLDAPGALRMLEKQKGDIAAALPADAAAQLFPLSNVFYSRIASRRFNSRATFEDPSVRQFFQTVAGYSDYYAALVDALESANIRYSRPSRIDLLEAEVSGSGNVLLKLRYVGRNDLPLRWWNASLVRTDEWSWREGRWYVVPGKV